MDALTARQTQILKALIDEYIETTEPVGSLALEKKYNLGVSPATIRNEMFALTKAGYLKQPHTSAGRVPTPLAMKFYINQLMEEKQMGLAEEVKAKEMVWDSRDDFDELMESSTKALSQKAHALSVAATDDGSTWSYGYSQLFNSPEFMNFRVCQSLFSVLEEQRRLQELFFNRLSGASPIEVLFGSELGWDFFDPIGIVAARFESGKRKGAIGVVGPFGLNYPTVIPTVRYFGNLIQQLIGKP
jgi:transcriptional regulator of heat shock response